MTNFKKATSLSEIIEESQKNTVIVFKFSSECNSSIRLEKEFEKSILEKKLNSPIYKVIVQDQPALSKNISEFFDVKHESPQILIVNKGKLTYTAHHNSVKIEDFVFTQ